MDYDQVNEKIKLLKAKYQLMDFQFDTEAIYALGDLSDLLKQIIGKTLSGHEIGVSEEYSENKTQYIATLTCNNITMKVYADVGIDWLPDTFWGEMESIPEVFKTGLKYYSINPAIGLTGQDVWYFCGTESNLKQARKEGLPLIFPGEDIFEAREFKDFNS